MQTLARWTAFSGLPSLRIATCRGFLGMPPARAIDGGGRGQSRQYTHTPLRGIDPAHVACSSEYDTHFTPSVVEDLLCVATGHGPAARRRPGAQPSRDIRYVCCERSLPFKQSKIRVTIHVCVYCSTKRMALPLFASGRPCRRSALTAERWAKSHAYCSHDACS